MKKLFLALLTIGSIASAHAQLANSILLYGDLGITTNKDTASNKSITWHAAPGIGYQFNKNWAAGINLMWGQQAFHPDNGPKDTYNMYRAGVFGRYINYIGHSNMFFWYGQLDLSYTGGYHTSEGNPADQKYNGFSGQLYPAIGINVGCNVAINFSIGGIGYTSTTPDGASSANSSFNFNLGKDYNIGISKNFGGHKMKGHHEMGDDMRSHTKATDGDDDDSMSQHKEHSKHGKKKMKDKDSDDDQ